MDDKEKKHARTKLILRIAGCCMILAGLALAVTGLMSLFSADEEAPDTEAIKRHGTDRRTDPYHENNPPRDQ